VAKNAAGSVVAVNAPLQFTTIIEVPGSFALTAPSNNSTNRPTTDTLRWSASVNASSYDVYLDVQNPPVQIVSQDQPGISYVYAGLQQGTVYYWKVIANNVAGNTISVNAPWNFSTLSIIPPGAFSQTLPQNGAVDQPLSVVLQWNASAAATRYDVYVDTLPNPATLVGLDQIGTSFSLGGLSNNSTYYWKVVAKNTVGTIVASGSPWHFGTITVPKSFNLLDPPDQVSDQFLSGSVSWEASQNATMYDVYLDNTYPPQAIVSASITATSIAYNGLLPNTTYFWSVIARNSHGSLVSSNAPRSFQTGDFPLGPSSASVTLVTTHGVALSWTDNSTNETGYRVYRSLGQGAPYIQYGGDLAPNTTTFIDTGLAVNQSYSYRIIPFNGIGEGAYADVVTVTLAEVPGIPVLSDATYRSVHVIVAPVGNPPSTSLAIRVRLDSTVQFVQQNGSTGDSPVWQSFADWGGQQGLIVSGLRACRSYSFSVVASNEEGVETSDGPSGNQTLPCMAASKAVGGGWDLISLPVGVQDLQKSTIFPTSTSNAFAYNGNYVSQTLLEYGKGYWLKFELPENLVIEGEPRESDSVIVEAGWNLFGSISQPIAVSSIIENPPGIIQSNIFGYDGAYSIADTLSPLHGYWVRVGSSGKLFLKDLGALSKTGQREDGRHLLQESLVTLKLQDDAGHHQELFLLSGLSNAELLQNFLLPPVPPLGSFDARFVSRGSMAEFLGSREGQQDFPIAIQEAYSPLTLSWKLAGQVTTRYSISDGKRITRLESSGKMQIFSGVTSIVLRSEAESSIGVPKEFMLYPNSPNPFNPSTEIRYDIPLPSEVEIFVTNLLGQKVTTLIQRRQEAGQYSVVWSPEVATGIYFCVMKAHGLESSGRSLFQVQKMVYTR